MQARDALLATQDKDGTQRLRTTLLRLLDEEIQLAKQLLTLASSDSRLGFEASNHYFFVPTDLVEKVLNCDYLKTALPSAIMTGYGSYLAMSETT